MTAAPFDTEAYWRARDRGAEWWADDPTYDDADYWRDQALADIEEDDQ